MKSLRWLSLVFVMSTGCITTPFDYQAYEAKATGAAQGVLSAVNTARLAIHSGANEKLYLPYLEVALKEAENEATGIQGQFDSVQPPGPDSEKLQSELDEMMQTAGSTLTQLRIHARRGEVKGLVDRSEPLNEVSDLLDRFQEEHQK